MDQCLKRLVMEGVVNAEEAATKASHPSVILGPSAGGGPAATGGPTATAKHAPPLAKAA